LDQSRLLTKEGEIAITAKRTFMDRSALQGGNIAEVGELLLARNTETSAAEQHRRKFKKIGLADGRDEAATLTEEGGWISHVNQTMQAETVLKHNATTIQTYASQYNSQDISWTGESIIGIQNGMSSSHVQIEARDADLNENSIQSHSTLLHIERALDLSHSEIHGSLQVKAHDINAEKVSIYAHGSVTLHADGHIAIRGSDIQALKLEILGDSIARNRSKVSAGNLTERASSSLDASESTTTILGEMIQISGGNLALPFSHATVGGSLQRSASGGIEHYHAYSSAAEHHVHTSWLNLNRSTLSFTGGPSTFDVDNVASDQETALCGSGSVRLNSAGPFYGFGTVDIDGLYAVKAPTIAFNTPIRATEMEGYATSGSMHINRPIHSKIASFTAQGYIEVDQEAPLLFDRWADFSAHQLWNLSSITSKKQMAIHQRRFRELDAVQAKEHLALTSDSSIHLTKPSSTQGGLSLISYGATIHSKAPLNVGGDLHLQGGAIRLDREDLHVAGKALFQTPGELHLKRMHGHIGKEMYADVGTFFNDGSNFICHGDLHLKASAWLNRNFTHLLPYRTEVGRQTKRICGVKVGSTPIMENRCDIIIDAVANMQVFGKLTSEVGNMMNDGVIAAGKWKGQLGNLSNGIFTDIGRTPESFASKIENFQQETFRPGGAIRIFGDVSLEISGSLRNRGGVIKADGRVRGAIGCAMVNERRVTVESTEVVRTGFWGRHSVRTVDRDHLEPGGEILGGSLSISMGKGTNRGGVISAGGPIEFVGEEFSNEALHLRTINILNSGPIAPWKKAQGYSVGTDFAPAQIVSGSSCTLEMDNRFRNIGSSVIGWDDACVIAGEIKQETLFSSHLATEKRHWKKSADLYAINMQEGQMASIAGNLHVESTRGSTEIEGLVGSYGGMASLRSAHDIIFTTRTESVENEVSTFVFTPTTVTFSESQYNSCLSSTPHFFAGGGSGMMDAKGTIRGDAVQFTTAEDLSGNATEICFTDHRVEWHQGADALSFGIGFFGSQALESITSIKPPHSTLEALLREDPAISSAYNLARANGIGVTSSALLGGVNAWNEAGKFAQAFNEGHFKEALGAHLGVTDSKGKFDPHISIRFGSASQYAMHTQSLPTRFSVGGRMAFTASTQIYKGCEVSRLDRGALFVGDEISFEAATERFEGESSALGLTVGFGPAGPSLGVDYAEQMSRGTSHQHAILDFGKSLKIHAKSHLSIKGVSLEADLVDVTAQEARIESLQDSYSHRQRGGAISTTGDFSYQASHADSLNVNSIAGIKARKHGTFRADRAELIGGSFENCAVEINHLQHRHLEDHRSVSSFSTRGNIRAIAGALSLSPSTSESHGLSLLGILDYGSSTQQETTLATIAGANGDRYGVNTNLNTRQRVDKDEKLQIVVPAIVPNFEGLKRDWQEINRAIEPLRKPRLIEGAYEKLGDSSTSPLISIESEAAKIKAEYPVATTSSNFESPVETVLKVESAVALPEAAPQLKRMPVGDLGIEPGAQEHPEQALIDIHPFSPWVHTDVGNFKYNDWIEGDGGHSLKAAELSFVQAGERTAIQGLMAIMRGSSLLIDALNYPVDRAIDFFSQEIKQLSSTMHIVCLAHPSLNEGCRQTAQQVSRSYKSTKKFISRHTHQSVEECALTVSALVSEYLANYQHAINRSAIDLESRLGIPRSDTYQLARDSLNILSFAAAIGIVKGVKALHGWRRTPKVEILPPGEWDMRSLLAKDVTPAAPQLPQLMLGKETLHKPLLIGNRSHFLRLENGNPLAEGGKFLEARVTFLAPLPIPNQVIESTGSIVSLQVTHHCNKKSCLAQFFKDIENFERSFKTKSFAGILENDLVVVQYHSNAPVGQGRSLNWWIPAAQANEFSTVEAVKDGVALLSSWGERTHVTVARIPSGESLRYLHGKAKSQSSTSTSEFRPGGALQMRIKDFNPDWIIETRELPITSQVPPKPPLRAVPPANSEAVNSKNCKTLKAIFTTPPPSNVPWKAVEALFLQLGAQIKEGNGSRMSVTLKGRVVHFHRPHSKDTDKGALVSVRKFLTEVGIEK
jgi:hypothetical protein